MRLVAGRGFAVNRSGVQIPVWAGSTMNIGTPTAPNIVYDKRTRVGTLLVNEWYHCAASFTWTGATPAQDLWGWEIWFLSPTGFRQGFLHGDQTQANFNASVLNFSLETITHGGAQYRVWSIQNERAPLFIPLNATHNPGTSFSSLAVGTQVANLVYSIQHPQGNGDRMEVGDFRCFWFIDLVRRGGVWTPAINTGADAPRSGMIQTGIRTASGSNTIRIRTSLSTVP